MIKGVIFDLDGVIVSTDRYHYLAWKKVFDEEEIPFSKELSNTLRGLSRRDSLEQVLAFSKTVLSEKKKEEIREKKNNIYKEELNLLTPNDILPGFLSFLSYLKRKGIRTAVGSSSKNTKTILKKLGLFSSFDAIADGTRITKAKPDPEVFLLAAKKLSLPPKECAVIEDGRAGINAAKTGGRYAIAIKEACANKKADLRCLSFADIQEKLPL